ncbi:MAG: HEAT repeat domain-containing protein, partial [Verrucomicrobia bacterium]|nr:HEAT repeat domain-containing protein [Verrucomicrobiota bacterium]
SLNPFSSSLNLHLPLNLLEMRIAHACLLSLLLVGCSRPDARLARDVHQLLDEGKLQQAQDNLNTALRQFPESIDLRQERLHLNLLAGQPELAAAEARQILLTSPIAQPYRKPLHDPSPAVRSLALRAFALDPPARPSPISVIHAALKDPDPAVRREAIDATRILSQPDAIPLLRQSAKDSDWLTRAAAARLLGSRADPSVIPDLFSMLGDRDSYVRRFARRSLLELATQSTPQAYLPALKSKDRTTQVVAALALARLNDGRGLDILLAEVINPLGIERVEVVKSAVRVKDPRVVPAIRNATGDTDPEIRVVALIALGLLHDKDSASLMKKISTDSSAPKEVRLAASKALELLTQPLGKQ